MNTFMGVMRWMESHDEDDYLIAYKDSKAKWMINELTSVQVIKNLVERGCEFKQEKPALEFVGTVGQLFMRFGGRNEVWHTSVGRMSENNFEFITVHLSDNKLNDFPMDHFEERLHWWRKEHDLKLER